MYSFGLQYLENDQHNKNGLDKDGRKNSTLIPDIQDSIRTYYNPSFT